MSTTRRTHPREVDWLGYVEDCTACAMKCNPMCGELHERVGPDRSALVDQLAFGAHMTLYRKGERARQIFIIRKGLVKLVQRAGNGAPRILRLLRPGDLAGLEVLTGGEYRHTAETIQETEVCRIPEELVASLGSSETGIPAPFMKLWEKDLNGADEVITQLSTGLAQGRVARFLLNTLSAPEEDSCTALSREDLSALLSVTVETVSRTVAEFKRKGYLEERQCRFYFDRDALSDAAML